MSRPNYTTVVLDLGRVLVNYTAKNTVGLSSSQISCALDSPEWHDYERGKISEQEAYAKVTQDSNIDLETWTQALEQMRDGMKANHSLISSIKDLKQIYPNVKVFCLSNIPRPEVELLKDEIGSWGIIDQFFASSDLEERKPDLAIYKAFLKQLQVPASSCIFVDDKAENVSAAQTVGFKGIVFKDNDSLVRVLHNSLGDPVSRAQMFLRQNAKKMFCTLSTGQIQPDNYSQLVILQNTGDRDLVLLENERYTWNYFQGKPKFAGTTYPDDSDTTSLAMTILEGTPMADKVQARDRILSNLNHDGLPYPYSSRSSAGSVRRDLASVIVYAPPSFASSSSTSGKTSFQESTTFSASSSKQGLTSMEAGTKNVQIGCFTFSLISAPADLQTRILKRCETYSSAAMRVLSAQCLGLKNNRDLGTVLEGQQVDGGWELAWLWGYGSKPLKIGSRGVVTAMALNAIRRAQA